MAYRCRIWAASTTWRACRRKSARHPSCCYRSREIHACEFAGFVIANFTCDNVFCHSLNLSKEVVYFTEAIYSAGKVWLHVLTGEVREAFRDFTAGSTRRFTRRARAYNTVHVRRIIPHVRGVDYRERDVNLRDSWSLR